MNLYQALQAILGKIKDNRETAHYSGDRDMMRAMMDNQERLGEAILVLGGMLEALIEKNIEVQLQPGKDEKLQ